MSRPPRHVYPLTETSRHAGSTGWQDGDHDGLLLRDIAETEGGITAERVRQVIQRAVRTLRWPPGDPRRRAVRASLHAMNARKRKEEEDG